MKVMPANLAELVEAHQAGVWRYLRFLGCDEPSADDLTQETFLSVHRRPFEQRSEEATTAYLRTVARNLFLMTIRKSKRRAAIEHADVADEVWTQHAGGGGEQHLDALRGCVERLNGRPREAIDLCYEQGRSRAEIAEALGMSEDGVKSLLRRTRDALRKCVDEQM